MYSPSIHVEATVILGVEVRVSGLFEQVVVVHRPAVVVEHFVVEVFYCGHHLPV